MYPGHLRSPPLFFALLLRVLNIQVNGKRKSVLCGLKKMRKEKKTVETIFVISC